MSKIAVVYWSGTGNTEAMANQIVQAAKEKEAQVDIFTASEFEGELVDGYEAIAFGCPSMGAEQLEEGEFEPMFESCLPYLSGKNITLFGSYGWGDGEWMEEWKQTCLEAGANLVHETVICNEYPDQEALEACIKLAYALVG